MFIKTKVNESFLGFGKKSPSQKLLANKDFQSACNGYYHSQTRQSRDLWRAEMNRIALETLDEKDFGSVNSINKAISDIVVKAYQNWKPTARMDEIIMEEIENLIKGGKGDHIDSNSVDQNELRMGITTEFEHVNDREKAREIALDHLAENPRYYTILKQSGLADELNESQVDSETTNIQNWEKTPEYIKMPERLQYAIRGIAYDNATQNGTIGTMQQIFEEYVWESFYEGAPFPDKKSSYYQLAKYLKLDLVKIYNDAISAKG